MTTKKKFDNLYTLSRDARVLEGIQSLLEWDLETYMPKDAIDSRSEQLKVLAGIIHQKRTSEKYRKALEKHIELESGKIVSNDSSDKENAALREWRRDYQKNTALPKSFVEKFAEITSQGIRVWQEAKQKDDFSLFEPTLSKIIELNRKKADFLRYDNHPYDALIDLYEPDMTTNELSHIFDSLKNELSPFVKKIASQNQVEDSFLFGSFSHEKQIEFAKIILKAMGYDFKKGRLDLAPHPFSSAAHPHDSRVTTRIHESGLISNISSVIHEGGHSLYDMALPTEEYGSPLCEAVSYGIHESQSRFWETRIGLSNPFWNYFLPKLKTHFNELLTSIDLTQFYKGINKVQPGFIRVESDEVTYNLHIILRFEIEKGLIEGNIKASEIPDIWNEKFNELLHIKPKNNKEGCLQDIHWSMGAFGYFPSYALGNLYASQMFLPFEKAHPDWKEKVSHGDLLFIKKWLNTNVHQYGRQYSPQDLIQKIEGHKLSHEPYMAYLKDKYETIYSIE